MDEYKTLEEFSNEDVEVVGQKVMDDLFEIKYIRAKRNYEGINDFSPLADRLTDSLNENNDVPTKGWKILEKERECLIAVSGIYDKNDLKYKSYGIKIDGNGVILKPYKHNLNRVPNKEESSEKMLKNQAKALADIIGECTNA